MISLYPSQMNFQGCYRHDSHRSHVFCIHSCVSNVRRLLEKPSVMGISQAIRAVCIVLMPFMLASCSTPSDCRYEQMTHTGLFETEVHPDNHYFEEKGSTQSLQEAIVHYRQAAENNDPYAQYVMSIVYRDGLGVKVNFDESVKWYQRASRLSGHVHAQYRIAQALKAGIVFAPDPEEAFKWFELAANAGLVNAQIELGNLYYIGDSVEKDFSKAFSWYLRAAQQGSALAQYNVGMMFYNGRGVEKNSAEAATWFTKAAKKRLAVAQYNLGNLFKNGDGVTQDKAEAFAWLSISNDNRLEDMDQTMKDLMKDMKPQEQARAIRLAKAYQQYDQR